MSWNYRVLKHVDQPRTSLGGEPYTWYGVHEVYYDSRNNPRSCSTDPTAPIGETPEELKAELARMTAALEKPIIDYDSF